MTDYHGGNLLLVWNRSPDNRFHRHEMDSGSIDIDLKIRAPLANTVLIYATYSTSIDIDNNVFIDRF